MLKIFQREPVIDIWNVYLCDRSLAVVENSPWSQI